MYRDTSKNFDEDELGRRFLNLGLRKESEKNAREMNSNPRRVEGSRSENKSAGTSNSWRSSRGNSHGVTVNPKRNNDNNSGSFGNRLPGGNQLYHRTGSSHSNNNTGARPKQSSFNGQPRPPNDRGKSPTRQNNDQRTGKSHGHRKKFPLDFHSLKKMMDEDTEPQNVVQRFTDEETGLTQCLKNNAANWEILELVLAVTGRFCEKGGVALFHNAFINIIKTLAEMQVFKNIDSVFMSIPKSQARNLGLIQDRLNRLITSISHITTEMLTAMPAYACNSLGKNFFEDIKSLKNMPKIRENTAPNAFDVLEEVAVRLENAWEQHNKSAEDRRNQHPKYKYQLDSELFSAMQPPDDFRQLSVMPQWEDVCTEEQPFLRPNIVKGSYPDIDTYLDIQFRLLREDFFNPLRTGLLAYKKQIETKEKRLRVDNIRLYFDVKIHDDPKQANRYNLEFSTKGFQRLNWEGSKRLLFGSLLLLSADDFKSFILFTVVDRKPDQLARGQLKVQFEGSKPPPNATRTTFVMAESSVFFEAYRSVLIALQRISPAHFPMKNYLLCRHVLPRQPTYLAKFPSAQYDLTPVRRAFPKTAVDENGEVHVLKDDGIPLVVQRLLMNVSILNPDDFPDHETLGLDPSQAEALYVSLTRRLVVIQGPPGTGKTFLGLKIVHTLLHNKSFWTTGVDNKPQPSPILVICYTNHALDQFLEGIMKFTQKIVRIGGQSKCEALQPFSLMEWKKKARLLRTRPARYRNWINEAWAKLKLIKSELETWLQLQRKVTSAAIVHEDSLLTLGLLPAHVHQKFLALRRQANSAFPSWLGLESIKILIEVLGSLKKIVPVLKKPTVHTAARLALDDAEPVDEDEWDKEDVDEIQGQRMIFEDEDIHAYDDVPDKQTEAKHETVSQENFRFAFTTETLDQKIAQTMGLLASLEGDDVKSAELLIEDAYNQKRAFEELIKTLPNVDLNEFNRLVEKDFLRLTHLERWKIYSFLRTSAIEKLEVEISSTQAMYKQQESEMKDVESMEHAEIIREAHVVGITTTGAAKQRPLLERLQSKIVVVEEAAEVLEAHIVTALTSHCQQLILIGDHQQLRPPTTVYHLAKDYHLDVSLFERMIKNGMEPCVLEVQHRMRPEIARLIVPSIYPRLKNHESVLKYQDVSGMLESVFFLNHTQLEKGDKSDQESRSHLNPYEADMALALTRHLLLQGYSSSQITILTTYSGQFLHFRKLRRSHATLQGVRISVVDNFQGEENDIIILSLVRSNEDANVGFLKTENRICVALSRAKQGFYLLGNMGNLVHKSSLWRQISQTLVNHGQIGQEFKLLCEVHHTVIKASQVSHFPPEGGCFVKCLSAMPCGHICPKICHVEDRSHEKQKCHEACRRTCSVGHPCPKRCYQDCNPCLTKLTKLLKPCNHTQIVECYKNPEEVFCLTRVIRNLPICQHAIEMDCGTVVTEVKCPETCGMVLNCQHICDRICHKRSSHENMQCTKPCMRSPCPEKHPCPKRCFEDCGKCMVDVVKTLPCGHEGTIKCWSLPKDAYCKIKVRRILSNCQHTAVFDCSQSTEGYKCTRVCEKILCTDGHPCRKLCWEPCGPCDVPVERTLPCGHTANTVCHKDPAKVKCKFPKKVYLPSCGHEVTIACGDNISQVICPKPCDIRLDCGHQCTNMCHVKNDPNHEKYECKKICSRKKLNCKQNHPCGKRCHEDCDLCCMKVHRDLPCGHSTVAECHLNDEDIPCKVKVEKTIIDCGHKIKLQCSIPPTRNLCIEPCTKRLPLCGHTCKKKCSEICSSMDCDEPVKFLQMSYCGHQITRSCIDSRQSTTLTEDEKIKYLEQCKQTCRAILSCEHPCKGTCSECFNGRLHKACEQSCGRTLVCGHNCGVNCAVSCPPCKKECEYKCPHSRCSRKCCEPCVDCIEPCGWKCDHYACTRKCFEQCNRPRCDEPCRKKLRCGHPCIGLCGEICPPLCRICHKEALTEFILYGTEGDDDARFVYLEDCKHTIEVEGMDHWMSIKEDETNEIQMKCCPRCKTIIRSCYRYGRQIKQNFNDIVEVKKIILKSRVPPQQFTDNLLAKIKQVNEANNQLSARLKHSVLEIVTSNLKEIQDKITPRKKQNGKTLHYHSFDEDTRFMFQVQVDIISRVLDSILSATKPSTFSEPRYPMKQELVEDIVGRANRLVISLFHRERFSSKEHECFVAECDRLDLVQAFYSLKSVPNYEGITLIDMEKKLIEEMLMKNTKHFQKSEKNSIKETLKNMATKLRTGLGISSKERDEILKAVGLSQGHWFKCPNGHIYAIGECGGAMETSKCNECGAMIGGRSHTLLSNNSLAREMDGARFAAWSDQANNMGNFDLHDLN